MYVACVTVSPPVLPAPFNPPRPRAVRALQQRKHSKMQYMKTAKDGREYATVSRDSRMVVAGEQSLDDWDDEELLHGRRRDKGGAFRGPKPKMLSTAVVRELQRRRFAKAHALLADSLVDAVQFLRAVLNDKQASKACASRPRERSSTVFLEDRWNSSESPWTVADRKSAQGKLPRHIGTSCEPRPFRRRCSQHEVTDLSRPRTIRRCCGS